MSATLIVVMTVTPVRFAVSIAVDAIAVLVSVGPMIVGSMGDDAAGYAHYHRERTQCSHPIKFIHSFVLLEIVARGNAGGHFDPRQKNIKSCSARRSQIPATPVKGCTQTQASSVR